MMYLNSPQVIKAEHESRLKAIEDENRHMISWSGSTGLRYKPGWLESLRRIVQKSPEA